MSEHSTPVPAGFPQLLKEVKDRVQQSQTRAILAVNSELVRLYWDIGRIIDERQRQKGWGAAVIPRLSRELRNELPEVKGFSERNIKSMLAFYRAYPDPSAIVQQAVAQLPGKPVLSQSAAKSPAVKKVQQPAAQLPDCLLWAVPWGHHVLLMLKVKNPSARLWYMRQTLANGWSRNVLLLMIKSDAHARQGQAVSNFERLLPSPQSDLVQQTLKDPYIFDFLTLEEPFHEHELVIDLKKGEFKPEHAGKMNFYLGVVDDKLRHATADAPTIGLILCQDRNHVVAEYALRDMDKPIGISEYELTRALPAGLKSALPTVEEIEAELADSPSAHPSEPTPLRAPKKRKAAKASKPAKKRQSKKGRRNAHR